jgi:pantoate kinase
MKSAKAFSPGNITCFFVIVQNKNPLKKGSLGVSFAVDKGAFVEVKKSDKNILIVNKIKKGFPTVETAIKMLTSTPLKIIIKTQLPIGCGYGMSGACTLAAVYAVNSLLNLKKSSSQLALIAHKAEVINNTGLGTVTAEFLGGFLIRHKKGSPLHATKLKISNKIIYYRSFGPLDTKKIITSKVMKKKINSAGLAYLKRVGNNATLGQIISFSKQFAEKTGLLNDKKLIKQITEIEKIKGAASMNMLGRSVFSNIPFAGCKKMKISKKGARLI